MSAKTRKKAPKDSSIGGTYVYDKELGKLVKVSDRVPKVASKRPTPAPMGGGCGRGGGCGGGRCGSS